MFRNSKPFPLPNGRPRDVWLLSASTCPPRLWLCTEGKLLPGYGRLRNVPLSCTPIFDRSEIASPFTFVCHADSRWQNAFGHCPAPPRNGSPFVPPQEPKI